MERASDTREMTWEGRGRGSVGQRLKKVTNFRPQRAGVDLSHAHLASIQPWHTKHPGLEEARAGSGQDEGQQVKGPKVADRRHQQRSPLSLREEDAAPHTTTDHFAGLHSLGKLPCIQSPLFPGLWALTPPHLRAQPTWSRAGEAQQVPSAGPLPSGETQTMPSGAELARKGPRGEGVV